MPIPFRKQEARKADVEPPLTVRSRKHSLSSSMYRRHFRVSRSDCADFMGAAFMCVQRGRHSLDDSEWAGRLRGSLFFR